MNLLVKMVSSSDNEIVDLRNQFSTLDQDGNGMIKAKELKEICLQKAGQNLSKEEVEEIIKEVDYAGNGKINYSEFLTATVDISKLLSGKDGNAKIRAIF